MLNSAIHGRYTMLADVYAQIAVRNESGQIVRTWDYDTPVATVKNLTEGILGGGIRVVGSTEVWGEDYEEVDWARMFIGSQNIRATDGSRFTLSRRYRIGNIRDRRTKTRLWLGDDGESIIFNIVGIQPIRDPFGGRAAQEYELLIKGVTGD